MKIDRVELHHVEMALAHPFVTSFGLNTKRACIIVVAHSASGLVGLGECVAMTGPYYSSECVGTAWHVLQEFLVPAALHSAPASAQDLAARLSRVRGHHMAKAALESAYWDLLAKEASESLKHRLGGEIDRVQVGVSVGIEPSIDHLLDRVQKYVDEGYRRVKLKIKPGSDVAPVRAVRERWPDLPLQVDANSAYSYSQRKVFHELDALGLLLIEQPFHHDDLYEHSLLQKDLKTPLCLDESIQSPDHARWALAMGSCKMINIKVGRVGGLTAALEIHDLCRAASVPVWCGGMLETNIGRACNLALASLPGFTLPGDISASKRYFEEDLATPDFSLNADGTVTVPEGLGLGVELIAERLHETTLRSKTIKTQTLRTSRPAPMG